MLYSAQGVTLLSHGLCLVRLRIKVTVRVMGTIRVTFRVLVKIRITVRVIVTIKIMFWILVTIRMTLRIIVTKIN